MRSPIYSHVDSPKRDLRVYRWTWLSLMAWFLSVGIILSQDCSLYTGRSDSCAGCPLYAPPNPGDDLDHDGLDDYMEMELAKQFFPTLHYDLYEACPSPLPRTVIFRARKMVSVSGIA